MQRIGQYLIVCAVITAKRQQELCKLMLLENMAQDFCVQIVTKDLTLLLNM